MNNTRDFSLSFGILSDPISKQIRDQGLKVSEDSSKLFKMISKGLEVMRFYLDVPDKMYESLQKRAFNKVVQIVEKENKVKIKRLK